MYMKLIELIKQVTLLATKGTQNREVCGVCSDYGHRANIYRYQREPIVSH